MGKGEWGKGLRLVRLSCSSSAAASLTLFVDVREPREAEIARIDGARNIPLRELPGRLAELPGHGEIVTLCHHGPRSLKAREILRGAGFSSVRSLAGGIDAWSREVDDTVPRY